MKPWRREDIIFVLSCEFSQDVLVFKSCCSLQLRENSELGVNPLRIFLLCLTSPGEICCYLYLWICVVLTLTTKCPRTTLCNQCSRTTLLCCILLGEMWCCLYLRICAVLSENMRCKIEFAVLYKCWKNCWMNPHVSALFTVFLTEKGRGFPKRCFSFFHSYNTPFF